jgi:hypothetical protein
MTMLLKTHSTLFLSSLLVAGASIAPAVSAQTPGSLFSGGSLGGKLGYAVANVGDVNNDGFDDFVAGSPADDANGPNAGRVSLISGANGAILLSRTGDNAGDQLGFSVSGVGGDVTGDGVPDFMAGAPFADNNGNNSGLVRVYNGANGATVQTFVGQAAGDRFGHSCAFAGAIAGAKRIIIGAPYCANGSTAEGSAYLYFATGGLLKEYNGTQTNEHFGWAVGGGFDINHDGNPDVVIGSPDYDDGGDDTGRAKVYSALTPYSNIQSQAGPGPGARFGYSVAVLEDANADDFADYIVGAPYQSGERGYVYVFNGQTTGIMHTKVGGANGDHYGWSVASAGDVNNDGKTDFVIGAPDAVWNGDAGAGVVSVFNGNGSLKYQLVGTAAGANCGFSVGGGGDINNDGLDDVILGWPGSNAGGNGTGSVYARNGNTGVGLFATHGTPIGDQLGFRVAAVGDVNVDGVPDYAIGVPYFDYQHYVFLTWTTEENVGQVIVVSGQTHAPLYAVRGDAEGDNFGYAIAACGDINKDGKADFVVGAPQLGAVSAATGYAKILSGADGSVFFTFNGFANGDAFGSSVAGAGDLNADTYPDVIIGSPASAAYGTKAGRADAYSGFLGGHLWTAKNSTANDQFGTAVAGLGGDINNDGKPDVVIGAPYHDASGDSAGAAYLVNGANGNILSTVLGAAGDCLGMSVAAAGDIDRDGKVDALVGAPYNDNVSGLDGGAVRVVSGATGGVIQSYLGIAGDALGYSVASAGDVDNDGVPDIAAGAPQSLFLVATGTGYCAVISGKTNQLMYRLAGLAPGNALATGDRFGASVAGVGDFDGDAVPDLVVGAPYADPDGPLSGVAQAYSLRPAGVSFYGTGSPGCQGSQFLTANRAAKVNNPNFGFYCGSAPANALGLLIVTDAQDLAGSDSLFVGVLFHVDFFGATELYGFDMVSDGFGFGGALTPIPNNPAIVGLDFYAQAAWLWNSCPLPPYGLSTSRAVKLVIQP